VDRRVARDDSDLRVLIGRIDRSPPGIERERSTPGRDRRSRFGGKQASRAHAVVTPLTDDEQKRRLRLPLLG
jgi:hypothetical protein